MADGEPDKAMEAPAEPYKVEKILAKRGVGEDVEYLLKWKCFGDGNDETSWEPITMLGDMQEEIASFEKTLKNNQEGGKCKRTKRETVMSSSVNNNKDGGSSARKKSRSSVSPSTPQPQGCAKPGSASGQGSKKKKNQSLFVCDFPECGQSFSCQGLLSFHKRKGHRKYQCRMCKISVENQHHSIIASKKDVQAHFTQFHPGVNAGLWFSYADEISISESEITESGNGPQNELSTQVPPVAVEASETQNSIKMELQSLKNQLNEKEEEIKSLRWQLRSVDANKNNMEEKLIETESELKTSQKKIKQLMERLVEKGEHINFLLREGMDLNGKCVDLEFKYEQLLLEQETRHSDIKLKCQCNSKVSDLEMALQVTQNKLGKAKEDHKNMEKKLKSMSSQLKREKQETQEQLKQAELDKKSLFTIIAEKEKQLESSLARIEQLLESQSEKDSRIKLLESEEMNRMDNQFEMQPQCLPEATVMPPQPELEDCKKRIAEMEILLEKTISQLVEAREEGLDKKSKLEAMAVMWRMENDKLRKKLDAFVKLEVITTLD